MRSRFVRPMRAHGSHESEMPLRGYFLSVGGALLTLLFAADWLMARPAPIRSINSHSELPVIRIHSELRGPDAVVIEASQPMILPLLAGHQGAAAAQSLSSPEFLDNTYEEPVSPVFEQTDADEGRSVMSVEPAPNVRDGFAQLMPGSLRHDDPGELKRIELAPQPRRKRARIRIDKSQSFVLRSRLGPALQWCRSSRRRRDLLTRFQACTARTDRA